MLLAVVIAWCVVRSIAAPVLFGQVFQLVPPVMLITMMPISIAGWGVREATMGLAFGYAGLMSSEGVNVSLLFGAVSFIVGAFGGLVWIFSAEKAAKGSAPIEVPEETLPHERCDRRIATPDCTSRCRTPVIARYWDRRRPSLPSRLGAPRGLARGIK